MSQSHFYTSNTEFFGTTRFWQWFPYLAPGTFREVFGVLENSITGDWSEISKPSESWAEVEKPSSTWIEVSDT
jgi:hypothetical protein